MTDKMYVVTETNFEYNDEVHRVGEIEGGTPVAVFTSKEEADKDARTRTVNNFLKGWGGDNLISFGYGLREIFRHRPKCAKMDDAAFWNTDELDYDLSSAFDIKTLSDEELEEIADSLFFSPYVVTEVSVG